MTSPDYSTWLTKAQAADAIGVSTKTIEAFAKDAKIQQAAWRPSGRGPEKAVYNPDDVARIAQERRPGLPPFVLPASSNGNGNGRGVSGLSGVSIDTGAALERSGPLPTGEEILRLVFAAALRSLASEKSETSENSQKLFLTIPEAAAVSGFSQAYLRRACRGGWSGAIKDKGWKIRRKDLEQL